MKKEKKLIILCCNPHKTIKEKYLKIDLSYFYKQAISSKTATLIYFKISSFKNKEIEKFKNFYYQNLTRNIILHNETEEILKKFSAASIKVIPLKGTFLSNLIYENIGARQISDIDILVDDIEKAKDVLKKLEYIIVTKPYSEEFYKNFHTHLHCIKKTNGIILEVHFKLTKPYEPFKIDRQIWQEVNFVKYKDFEIGNLSLENLLLYLCYHLRQHHFLQIGSLVDIVFFIEKYKDKIDWNFLLRKAKIYRMVTILYVGLYLSYQIFNISIKYTLKKYTPCLYKKIIIHLFISKKIFFRNVNLLKFFYLILFQFILIDSFVDGLKLFLKRIFPSKYELSLRYSIPIFARKIYFYYLLHPIFLILKLKRF